MPMSLDSQRFYERYRSHSLVGDEPRLLTAAILLTPDDEDELGELALGDEASESEQAYQDESECKRIGAGLPG